ncbi:Putative anti-sigma factor antagonist [Limihaloglobus sulfuriphilus]|uniref:Anti-sigma factor antagonist n=1 Tax=Limihaloglobus sulfuriphilus TaxID=1851148 RepID=A0A1Q2MDM0_9BACT|nr:STAS domain-containing protein [Limihaloglobus sulfuriphilus]AQQ70791.1 Putative anti-sigma factor antagonist [Limihaloglobus sulfuriphilus]
MNSSNGLVRIFNKDQIVIVSLNCKKLLEEEHINSVRDSILGAIGAAPVPKVLIDFDEVEFLSSAMLGALIKINAAVNEKKGKLALCNIEDNIAQIFKITALEKIFDIYDEPEEALTSLENQS